MITKFDINAGTAPAENPSNANTESAAENAVSPFASYPFYYLPSEYSEKKGKKQKKGNKGKKGRKKGKKVSKKSKSRSSENDGDREERAQARERELVWRNGYLTAQNETFRAIINMSLAASQGKLDSNVARVGLALPPPNNPPQTDPTLPPQSEGQ